MRVRLRFFVLAAVLILAVTACQSPPRTEYVIEVTREVTRIVVVTPTPQAPTVEASPEPTETATPTPQTPTPSAATPTADPFPTPTVNEIIVAEQLFQRGRLFYISPQDAIWVMLYGDDGQDETSGTWFIREDTWEEGMPEIDPAITPPSDDLFQPERGFGKLWRENEDIREALGWALEPELGHVTQFQFFPGGEVNAEGEYIPGPGTFTLRSRFGTTFIFEEADLTWGIAAAPDDQ